MRSILDLLTELPDRLTTPGATDPRLLGAIGLAGLVALLATVVVALRSRRRRPPIGTLEVSSTRLLHPALRTEEPSVLRAPGVLAERVSAPTSPTVLLPHPARVFADGPAPARPAPVPRDPSAASPSAETLAVALSSPADAPTRVEFEMEEATAPLAAEEVSLPVAAPCRRDYSMAASAPVGGAFIAFEDDARRVEMRDAPPARMARAGSPDRVALPDPELVPPPAWVRPERTERIEGRAVPRHRSLQPPPRQTMALEVRLGDVARLVRAPAALAEHPRLVPVAAGAAALSIALVLSRRGSTPASN